MGRGIGGLRTVRRTDPPRLFARLLGRAIPEGSASGPSVLGDLHQEFGAVRERRGLFLARVWYAAHALRIAVPYLAAEARAAGRDILQGMGADVRLSVRALLAQPAVTAVALLSLILGIGLTATATSVVDAVWFAPLPYSEPDRLVELEDDHPVEVCDGCSTGTSYRSYREWQELLEGVVEVGALSGMSMTITASQGREAVSVAAVSGNVTRLLGMELALGRSVDPGDDRPGAERVVVLSHALWTGAFGADPEILGRVVELDDMPHVVIGVLAESAHVPQLSRAWIALEPAMEGALAATSGPASNDGAGEGVDATVDPSSAGPSTGAYQDRLVWAIGRLAPGVAVADADRTLSAFATERYHQAGLEPGWTARVRPLSETLRRDAPPGTAGAALVAATFLVLLIAGLNLAALLLARATERARELGVRLALGSGKLRLLRLAGMEAALLAVLGGLGGVYLAVQLVAMVKARTAAVVPGWMDFSMDLRTLGAAVAFTAVTATLCGTLPVLYAATIQPGGIVGSLACRPGPARLRKQDWLLGIQVALGIVLVAGTVTAVGTVVRLSDFGSLGFRSEGIASVTVSLTPEGSAGGTDTGTRWVRLDRLTSALGAHPSAGPATAYAHLFLGSPGGPESESPVRVEGAERGVPNGVVPRHSAVVGPGYFHLLEIPIVAGRDISEADAPGAEPVAVVSRDAGGALWPGVAPTELPGRRFHVDGPGGGVWFTVVGVVEDVVTNYRHPSRFTEPRIYTALAQTPATVLRAGGVGTLSLLFELRGTLPREPELEALLARADGGATLMRAGTLEAEIATWLTPARLTTWVLGALSALAVGLLALGVYGTLRYRVASARFDMAVRTVMGARPWSLVRSVMDRVVKVLALAAVAGGVLAVPLGRITSAGDLPLGGGVGTVGAAVLLLALVCGLASVSPLRRATGVAPMESLRSD